MNDHDFRSDARGIAIPYGIYDTLANLGFVVVGTSYEPPAFAVDAVELRWKNWGCKMLRRIDVGEIEKTQIELVNQVLGFLIA